LAPDAARQLDQGVQDLSQARKLVAATCVGKKMTAVFSSGSGS
jgi:GMP synthase-like glutamine amidotransferase